MVNFPVFSRPGVGHIELGVALEKLSHESIHLASLLELSVKPEGQKLGGAYLYTLSFFVLYHLDNIWFEGGEKARWHLEFELEIGHGSGNEMVVAFLV